MYQTQMIKEGLAAAAYEELVNRFEEEEEDCMFEPGMVSEDNYILERLERLEAFHGVSKPGMVSEN